MIDLILPLMLAVPAPAPANAFSCTAGRKRIAIVQRGDTLIYSFGPPGRPEITLTGDPAGGVYITANCMRGARIRRCASSAAHSNMSYSIAGRPRTP